MCVCVCVCVCVCERERGGLKGGGGKRQTEKYRRCKLQLYSHPPSLTAELGARGPSSQTPAPAALQPLWH